MAQDSPGTPLGNSPIRAEGCAPIGLKYLNEIALMFLSETQWYSLIIDSPTCLYYHMEK